MNKYQRIKQLSVDEMANFIFKVCATCVLSEMSFLDLDEKQIKQWLLQECE